MRSLWYLSIFLLPLTAASQTVNCTSAHDTARCDDGDGNVNYTICSGDYCTSGSYHLDLEARQAIVDMVYNPMFHRNALCGLDDASGQLFPRLDKWGKVREPLLPKKNCIDNMYVSAENKKNYHKTFEKSVYDLCSTKKLDAKQCGILAQDIQYQKELDRVGSR